MRRLSRKNIEIPTNEHLLPGLLTGSRTHGEAVPKSTAGGPTEPPLTPPQTLADVLDQESAAQARNRRVRSVSGVEVGSLRSLPGDWFDPLKLAFSSVALAVGFWLTSELVVSSRLVAFAGFWLMA
jgi:hypothetical protein